jgi:hypothetical protein
MKITKAELKKIIKEELQHVMRESSKQEEELLEENLKSVIAGALMAFLSVAAVNAFEAPETIKGAKASILQMKDASGDAAAKEYATQLLKKLDPEVARAVQHSEELRSLGLYTGRGSMADETEIPGIGRIATGMTMNSPEDVEAFRRGNE